MGRIIQRTVVICLLSLLAACTTTMKATTLDSKTGRFSTQSRVAPQDITVQEPFKPEYGSLLYVKTDVKSEQFNDFFIKSFSQMKPYVSVLDKPGMESLVISRHLTDKVSNISDLVGLNRLAKEIGPFLVVEITVEWNGGYDYTAAFKTVDASTGQTVLNIKRKVFNWAGLDAPLFYPMLNAFAEWSAGQPIQTGACGQECGPTPEQWARYQAMSAELSAPRPNSPVSDAPPSVSPAMHSSK